MQIIVKTASEELLRARKWWNDLEMQWKMAYNEAVFGAGPTLAPPADDQLMMLLIGVDTLRLAGPMAFNSNVSTPLTNLSGLLPLYNLKYLSITHMNLREVRSLRHFTKLEHLFILNNKIKSLKGIENLTGLVDLYAQVNELEHIDEVKNLTNLKTFYCCYNPLKNLNGITEKHTDTLNGFFPLPNETLRDKDILRIENQVGIKCRRG